MHSGCRRDGPHGRGERRRRAVDGVDRNDCCFRFFCFERRRRGPVGVVVAHNRSEAKIRSSLAGWPHHGFAASYPVTFAIPPAYSGPYAAGKVAADRQLDALKALKAVRFLAGVPTSGISFTTANSNLAQHCTVLLAASNQFAHTGLTKPADMTNRFFGVSADGCASSNLYQGLDNLSSAIVGWASDPGPNNLEFVGHRGWEISTAGSTYGLGYGTFAGRNMSALQVFDNAAFFPAQIATDYVAWPNSGAFPLEYFWGGTSSNSTLPWSVHLGNAYQAPDPATVAVTLVRTRDGQTWHFRPTTQRPNGTDNGGNYLNVNPNTVYGMARSIIFRPSQAALGTILPGDQFKVYVGGIKTDAGVATTLKYTTTFFKLN